MRIKELQNKKHFFNKLQRSILISIRFFIFSLLFGIFSYMLFFNIPWDDALYNASMILTGMGPVAPAPNTAAKLFGLFYALYSGVAFLTSISVMMTSIYRRCIHKVHLNMYEHDED
jgi:hypothetical protein